MIAPDIRNWMRNVKEHASDEVVKILVGNKCDMVAQKVSKGSYWLRGL